MTCRKRLLRAVIVLVGLVGSQFLLYGSSLIGKKVLLPLDLLSEGFGQAFAHDRLLSDPVCNVEPMRQFAVSEIRAGRMPLWDPNNYSGAPFLANNQSSVFSPFRWLDYLWPDPRVLAWEQLLHALVGGTGAYLFFRRAMRARFFAATIGAWIWPQSGFLVLWTMWPLSAAALWLPCVLLAVNQIVRRPRARWTVVLALFTACTLVSGHSATGAHVLIASGLYAIWMLWRRGNVKACAMLFLGWLLGAMLAAPQVLPTADYLRGSLRIANRITSGAETAPVGWSALPQMLMPWIQGTTRTGWIYLGSDIPLESAIAGYAGLITVMVLAPFGFSDRRRRLDQFGWLALALIASAYVLNLPGGWALNRLPVLSSLRGNRFIFVSGFAFLAAGVAGMDVLLRNRARRNRWLLIAPAMTSALAAWCVWRYFALPDVVGERVAPALQMAKNSGIDVFMRMATVFGVIVDRFQMMHLVYAGVCVAATLTMIGLWRRPRSRILIVGVGLAALAEVLINAWPVNPQSDRALYDWKLPVYQAIASAEPGRICGINCLPPMMNQWMNLPDIRGYDAADPSRYVQFLKLLAVPNSPPPDSSAATYAFIPTIPSPLADFLNLRYLIYRGQPSDPASARFVTPDYYVLENRSAMSRVSVPTSANIIADDSARLKALADPKFDPRQTVILETGSPTTQPIVGEAHIAHEVPSRVEIDFSMQTDGYIVLADEWDAGWRAQVNGNDAPVLRANHAFRAVAVPRGSGQLIMSYEPLSFTLGLWIAGVGAIILMLLIWASRRADFSLHVRTERNRN